MISSEQIGFIISLILILAVFLMFYVFIKSKSKKFDPKTFKDSYQEGLQEIINAKLAHRKAKLPKARTEPGNVVNIMDALKKSLAQAEKSGSTKKKPKAKVSSKKTKKAA